MGGFKHTGAAAGSALTDYATLNNVINGTGVYVSTVGGTADVITLTPSPAITAYAAGQEFFFIASGANTTNVTVNVSALGAKAITKHGTTALVAGDIPSAAMIGIRYDGTQFQLLTFRAYEPGGTDVALADGGTGTSLTDPNADRIMFWDDSLGAVTWLATDSTLTISGTTISVTTAAAAAAVKADQTTGSATNVYVNPGVQQFHDSAIKMWLSITNSGGAVTTNGSYGVGTVTRSAAGIFVCPHSTAFTSTGFCVAGMYNDSDSANNNRTINFQALATNSTTINFGDGAGAAHDPAYFGTIMWCGRQ